MDWVQCEEADSVGPDYAVESKIAGVAELASDGSPLLERVPVGHMSRVHGKLEVLEGLEEAEDCKDSNEKRISVKE